MPLMPQNIVHYDLRQHSDTYRISTDPAFPFERFPSDRLWLFQIPCRRGHIFIHGTDTLAYTGTSKTVAALLRSTPDSRLHQSGAGEATATFPASALHQVAKLVHAKKRRHVSPEQRAASAARLAAFAFKKKTQPSAP